MKKSNVTLLDHLLIILFTISIFLFLYYLFIFTLTYILFLISYYVFIIFSFYHFKKEVIINLLIEYTLVGIIISFIVLSTFR